LTIRLAVLTQYRSVTDRQTDGQTDGVAVSISRVAFMNEWGRAIKIKQLLDKTKIVCRPNHIKTS